MVTKIGMYAATHESVNVPLGRDRKTWTALRTNHSLPCPPRKKIKW